MSEVKRQKNGRWVKGSKSPNPSGRPAASEKIRMLLGPHCDSLLEVLVQKALEGDLAAMKICLDRLAPALKSENVYLPGFNEAKSLVKKSEIVLGSIANGIIQVEAGTRIIEALKSHVKILEVEEIEKRLSALESRDN